jgi:hypothetical protein
MARALPRVLISGLSTTGKQAGPPGSVSKLSEGYSRRPPLRDRHGFRPEVEALEPRRTPSVTFSAQQTFAAGTGPYAVAVADFNGDGRPDLAVTNATSGTVSVLLNTTPPGSGTVSFAAQQTFAVGSVPVFVAVGEFNGDGRPDLVITNQISNTASVLLNTTPAGVNTVSFAAQQTFATGNSPEGVAVGDFNGDGRPDLVVTNYSLNVKTVSVLLNTTVPGSGTASFAAQQTFAVGNHPTSAAAADLNGDGRPRSRGLMKCC